MPDKPWEYSNMHFYGTVIYRPDIKKFQLWYTSVGDSLESPESSTMRLCYLESADGINFTAPSLSIYTHEDKPTNVVHPGNLHGCAVIYDDREVLEDRRYKMLAGIGMTPIRAYFSANGINWRDASLLQVIVSDPDCPIGFCRLPDGRYIATHRYRGRGRTVFASQSWDLLHWSDPQLVYEPDATDPPGTMVYGMGISTYGHYILGTPWLYHLDADDFTTRHGIQEPELAYARSITAWHRLSSGAPLLDNENPAEWESGNIQMSSNIIYLDDEIRFYYAASSQRHGTPRSERHLQKAGLGMASLRPDGFVSLDTGGDGGRIRTRRVQLYSRKITINADIAANGYVKLRLINKDKEYLPIEATAVHSGDHKAATIMLDSLPSEYVLLEISASNASIYSISLMDSEEEQPIYHNFNKLIEIEKNLPFTKQPINYLYK